MKNLYENETYLRKKEMLIYGISNGGQVLGYSFISSYLMYFYINVFTIDAKIISLFFLIGGIWDIINNPLIGTLIDHKNSSNSKLTSLINYSRNTCIYYFNDFIFTDWNCKKAF